MAHENNEKPFPHAGTVAEDCSLGRAGNGECFEPFDVGDPPEKETPMEGQHLESDKRGNC